MIAYLLTWENIKHTHAEIRTKKLRNRNLLTSSEDMKILRKYYERP